MRDLLAELEAERASHAETTKMLVRMCDEVEAERASHAITKEAFKRAFIALGELAEVSGLPGGIAAR